MALPKALMAACGFQSLALAIEAYLSVASTPLTDGAALQAISLLSAHLSVVHNDPTNERSREKLTYGKYLAALAYNSSSMGFTCALSSKIAERKSFLNLILYYNQVVSYLRKKKHI